MKNTERITVVEQDTNERKEETRRLFHKIKPFLDEGLNFNKAFAKAGLFVPNQSWRNCAWSRDVVEYAKRRGYHGR